MDKGMLWQCGGPQSQRWGLCWPPTTTWRPVSMLGIGGLSTVLAGGVGGRWGGCSSALWGQWLWLPSHPNSPPDLWKPNMWWPRIVPVILLTHIWVAPYSYWGFRWRPGTPSPKETDSSLSTHTGGNRGYTAPVGLQHGFIVRIELLIELIPSRHAEDVHIFRMHSHAEQWHH